MFATDQQNVFFLFGEFGNRKSVFTKYTIELYQLDSSGFIKYTPGIILEYFLMGIPNNGLSSLVIGQIQLFH